MQAGPSTQKKKGRVASQPYPQPNKQGNILPNAADEGQNISKNPNADLSLIGNNQQNHTANTPKVNPNQLPFPQKELFEQNKDALGALKPLPTVSASDNFIPLDSSKKDDIEPHSQNSSQKDSLAQMQPEGNVMTPHPSTSNNNNNFQEKEDVYSSLQKQDEQHLEANVSQDDKRENSFHTHEKIAPKPKQKHVPAHLSGNSVSTIHKSKQEHAPGSSSSSSASQATKNVKSYKQGTSKPPEGLINAVRTTKWNDTVYKILLNPRLNVFLFLANWLDRVKRFKELDHSSPQIKAQLLEIVKQAYALNVVSKVDWQYQTIGDVLYLRSGQMINIPLHVKDEIRLPFMKPSTKNVAEALAIAQEVKRLNESHWKKDKSYTVQSNKVLDQASFSKSLDVNQESSPVGADNVVSTSSTRSDEEVNNNLKTVEAREQPFPKSGETASTSQGIKASSINEKDSSFGDSFIELQSGSDVHEVENSERLNDNNGHEAKGSSHMDISLPSANTSPAYVAPLDPMNTNNYQYAAAMELPENSKSKTKIINDSQSPVANTGKKRTMQGKTSELSGQERKRARLQKFKIRQTTVSPLPSPSPHALPVYREDYGDLNKISNKAAFYDKNAPLVGTNLNLEKSFLRLTSEAKPENIRPLQILAHSYEYVLNRYTSGEAKYQYFCDQFKSIRQDLKVQLIETAFTIQVYSKHAEIALENGDLGEFNQCQSSLVSLFAKNLAMTHTSLYIQHCCFLILYRVLMKDFNSVLKLKCTALTHKQQKLEFLEQGQTMDAQDDCLDIDLDNLAIRVSLKINECFMTNDYHGFFKLYKMVRKYVTVPTLESQQTEMSLVRLFIEQCLLQNMRLKSFAYMARSCHTLSLGYLLEYFDFADIEQLLKFFQTLDILHSVKLQQNPDGSDNSVINCKECVLSVWTTYDKSKSIDIKGQV
ncbi:hypothetical protein ACO0QE_000071 [Hanseniaspora vineae]